MRPGAGQRSIASNLTEASGDQRCSGRTEIIDFRANIAPMLIVVQDAAPRLPDLAIFLAAVATVVLAAKDSLIGHRSLPPHRGANSPEGRGTREVHIPPS